MFIRQRLINSSHCFDFCPEEEVWLCLHQAGAHLIKHAAYVLGGMILFIHLTAYSDPVAPAGCAGKNVGHRADLM